MTVLKQLDTEKQTRAYPAVSHSSQSLTYCLLRSDSLAVMAAISPTERNMSSLSFGSSHMSAIFLASASRALMFTSPSGPPLGSASQFCRRRKQLRRHQMIALRWSNPCFRLMAHLRCVDPLGNGLLGVSHGLQFASSIFHLACEHIQPPGNLLSLLHGSWGCSLTPGVGNENTRNPLSIDVPLQATHAPYLLYMAVVFVLFQSFKAL